MAFYNSIIYDTYGIFLENGMKKPQLQNFFDYLDLRNIIQGQTDKYAVCII
jgi:hypothetical protein